MSRSRLAVVAVTVSAIAAAWPAGATTSARTFELSYQGSASGPVEASWYQ